MGLSSKAGGMRQLGEPVDRGTAFHPESSYDCCIWNEIVRVEVLSHF